MAEIELINKKIVGDYKKPYIVAELNTSHFGKLDVARSMIEAAYKADCDCVKFQSWTAETLYSKSYYIENPIAKRFVNKFSLSPEDLKELSVFSQDLGIDFASTPYSIKEAEFLIEKCNVPYIKIASMELNNLPYLKELGALNVPLVLSTGMGTWSEIKEAVNIILSTGNNKLIILHCTSLYPSDASIINLNNILSLRNMFTNSPIGYSDHTIGIEVPIASVALGSCMIEKHFTLDNSKIGMDNQMATEPNEMQKMIKGCHKVFTSMGSSNRILSQEEISQIPNMRRSVVSKRAMEAGEIISRNDLDLKRPGNGFPPSYLQKIIGSKIIKRIEEDCMISKEHINDINIK